MSIKIGDSVVVENSASNVIYGDVIKIKNNRITVQYYAPYYMPQYCGGKVVVDIKDVRKATKKDNVARYKLLKEKAEKELEKIWLEIEHYEYIRGHIGIETQNGEFIYLDTHESCNDDRTCIKCNKYPTSEGHDACLGNLDNVKSACCGHGKTRAAYITFNDDRVFKGQKAIDIANEIKSNKESDTQLQITAKEYEMEEIKMTRQEFFTRLSQGEIGAWNYEIEPCEGITDGVVHCFGNDDVHIAMSIGEDGESYYSYWLGEGVISIDLIDISHN